MQAMIDNNQKKCQTYIKIPLTEEKDLEVYKDGILGILSKVEIHSADQRTIGHLKTVYKLLDCIQLQHIRSVS
ncbi:MULTISPECIES: hypothetical protein [Aquimarina]|uniref:hypothetical protein n=2 Tax=Flavobacteriaceae TaxID=49546 RepID=UPI00046EE0FD|nr:MULTISPECIES: hypothetical protein [Aquimarina]MBG6131613.1 hypothetical protein [Aquimarina sp. EL_35]